MSLPPKSQNIFWWIASIAVSVLCCAVLFVLFAVYLCDVKTSIKNNEDNIAIIQQREERILGEIELIRKHIQSDQATTGQAADPAATVTPEASAGSAPAASEIMPSGTVPTTVAPVPPAASVTVPAVIATPPAPAPVAPAVGPASPAPANQVPQISVPSISAPADKK